MKELGALLLSKSDDIVDAWTKEVRGSIGSGYEAAITYEAVRSRLPLIVQAIAACFLEKDAGKSAEESLNAGVIADKSDIAADGVAASSTTATSTVALSSQLSKKQAAQQPEQPLERAAIRVELGFDIDEMLRELSILRALSMDALMAEFEGKSLAEQPYLKGENAAEIAAPCQWKVAISQIDGVLNAIVADSAKRHAVYQLEQVEPRHRELLSSNQELLRLVQMQKDNASHLAHELKNPLHAIATLSSLLLKNQEKRNSKDAVSKDAAHAREFQQVQKIHENSQHISRLIDNMLEVSRKDSQVSSLKLEPIDVAQLIEQAVESLAPVALEKGIELGISCDLAPPQIVTDSLRLKQIVVNLVSNAIRYTDSGQVQIECRGNGEERWCLSVRDTGRGINQEQQQQIFMPYFRAGKAASFPENSTGLGLAIVSELVALLQGEVQLTSTVGTGSTFTVTLPVSIAS